MKKPGLALMLAAFVIGLSVPARAQFNFTSEAEVQSFLDQIAIPLALTVSGGPLCPANTLGGLPHLRLGGEAQVLGVHYLQPGSPPSDSQNVIIPSLAFQGRIGLFPGIRASRAVGGILAVDGLYRVGYFPIRELDNPTFYGLGARVGLLRDRGLVPALSGTVFYSTFIQQLSFSNEFTYRDSTIHVYQVFRYGMSIVSYRLDVSKRLLLFTPYAGVGLDNFNTTANYDFRDSTGVIHQNRSWAFSRTLTRSYIGLQFGGAAFATTFEVGSAEGGHPSFAGGMSIGF